MLAIVLMALFITITTLSIVVLADSGLRAVAAACRLRALLRALDVDPAPVRQAEVVVMRVARCRQVMPLALPVLRAAA